MGWGGIGGAGALCFCTLFRLHDHVIQLVTSVEMLGCCSIHLSDCFCGNIAFTTCCFEFSLEHVLLAKLTMLHGIVVALCHTILGHVLPAKLITLHDIVVGRGQGQGLDLGWGGGSWGWAFSFLCFGIVECAHGHAYSGYRNYIHPNGLQRGVDPGCQTGCKGG